MEIYCKRAVVKRYHHRYLKYLSNILFIRILIIRASSAILLHYVAYHKFSYFPGFEGHIVTWLSRIISFSDLTMAQIHNNPLKFSRFNFEIYKNLLACLKTFLIRFQFKAD